MFYRHALPSLVMAMAFVCAPALAQQKPVATPTVAPVADQLAVPVSPKAFSVKIEGPSKVKSEGGFVIVVTKPSGVPQSELIERWENDVPPGVVWLDLTDNSGRPVMVFLSAPDGTYTFRLSCQVSVDKINGPDPFASATHTVVVGGGTPKPTPTDPVTEPDQPVSPDTAKVKVDGFRAMLLCEKGKGIPEAFASQDVRKYLNSKCVKGLDGITPDWRMPDNDESMDRDYPVFKLYRETLPPGSDETPYVSFGDGKRGFVGPAPATGEELLKLLQTIGGN